jgi:hypothetical protein
MDDRGQTCRVFETGQVLTLKSHGCSGLTLKIKESPEKSYAERNVDEIDVPLRV